MDNIYISKGGDVCSDLHTSIFRSARALRAYIRNRNAERNFEMLAHFLRSDDFSFFFKSACLNVFGNAATVPIAIYIYFASVYCLQ